MQEWCGNSHGLAWAGRRAEPGVLVQPAIRAVNTQFMNRFRFLASLLVEHSGYYLLGGTMLGLTLWMTVAIPRYLQQAIDILGSHPDPADSGFLNRIAWILAFAFAITVLRTGSRLFFFIPGRRVEFKLKNRLLEHLSTLQREFFLANPTGAIISRINNDINGIRMMMGFGLMMVVSSVAMLSLAPYEMYKIAPTLTLYITLPVVAAFLLLLLAIRRLRGLQLVQMKALQDLSDFTVESYNGIDVLKTYRALPWAEAKFTRFSDRVKNAAIRMASIRAFFMPILTHIVNALKVVLVLVGGVMVIEGEMTIGQFMAYALYLTMLLPPLMGMTFMMFVMQRGLTALVSLEAIFNTQPDIPPVVPESIAALPDQLRRGLKVQGLSYAYRDDPERPKMIRPADVAEAVVFLLRLSPTAVVREVRIYNTEI